MTEPPSSPNPNSFSSDRLPVESGRFSEPFDTFLDDVCDAFEAELAKNRKPAIEDYLAQSEPDQRGMLLRELLWIELSYLHANGKRPERSTYLKRFPDRSPIVEEVFESLENITHNFASKTARDYSQPPSETLECRHRYSHLRFLAKGGLGQVFSARDERLKRRVAIKFIREDFTKDEEANQRFLLETEVTSRLDHPGVVPVYAFGRLEDGRPYYAMRYIEGTTFRKAIDQYHQKERSLTAAEAKIEMHTLIRHLISACKTVAYAHNRGVLHRDVKPENIMLGKFGETLVVDWGLVHFVERDAEAKASGEKTLLPSAFRNSDLSSNSAGGTVGYLSPEQTPGFSSEVGPAADIYSFGATLYRVLTNSAPFHPQQGEKVWEKIRQGDFPPPRVIRSSCSPDLEAICLKAMASEPALRYSSALEMADDLERWLADEPVSVRKPSPMENAMRFARRHRTGALTILLSSLVVAFTGILLTFVLADKARLATDKARAESFLREQVEEARLTNLQNAARFAARGLGHDLDLRWNALYEAMQHVDSEGRTLYDLMVAYQEAESPEAKESAQAALQNWIEIHAWDWVKPVEDVAAAESWFICNRDGIQLARHKKSSSIGQPYHYRSYFQSKPYDLPPEVPNDEVDIIEEATLSSPYVGTETKQLKVVFSIPIRRAPGEEPIGVLGMGADLGEQLRTVLGEWGEKHCILVNLRPDTLAGDLALNTGVIVAHPDLEPGTQPHRVSPELVDMIQKESEIIFTDFVDPLAETNIPRPIAASKVKVDFRDRGGGVQGYASAVDSGWAVLVQDRPTLTAMPATP